MWPTRSSAQMHHRNEKQKKKMRAKIERSSKKQQNLWGAVRTLKLRLEAQNSAAYVMCSRVLFLFVHFVHNSLWFSSASMLHVAWHVRPSRSKNKQGRRNDNSNHHGKNQKKKGV
jgi:hypothetical protein